MIKESIAYIKKQFNLVRGNFTDLIYNKFGNWRYTPILLILLLGTVIGTTLPYLLGAMQSVKSIPSGGLIKAINVGVYNDSACTIPLTSITWGVLEPGSSEINTIYIKNEGNSGLTLSFITENWSPSNATDYIDLAWDYTGGVLNSGQSMEVKLTLTVLIMISGIESFNFDIVIVGTG